MLKCPHCHDWFSSKYNLKRHLNKKKSCYAPKDSGLICPECSQTFTQLTSLKYHWEANVCRDSWYFCSDYKCAAWFKSQIELDEHTKKNHSTHSTHS